MGLFIPTYFSPISQYAAIVSSGEVVFEVADNFQKQSYRNRCYIYGPNGKQLLNIPVKHPEGSQRKKSKDTLVENSSPWQKQHLKSLQAAYHSSPFFEFYKDDLQFVFDKEYKFLLDINIDTYLFLTDALQISHNFSKTTLYTENVLNDDFRQLASVKQHPKIIEKPYTQVFENKHGFLPNLSILDLLFMEGPNSISFLEKFKLT